MASAARSLFGFSLFCLLLVAPVLSSVAEDQENVHTEVARDIPPPEKTLGDATMPPPPKILPPVDDKACPGLCEVRCKLHSRPNHCKRVCNTCCFRCKCVPPGTAGNHQMCGPCYANMTTHGGKLKCP